MFFPNQQEPLPRVLEHIRVDIENLKQEMSKTISASFQVSDIVFITPTNQNSSKLKKSEFCAFSNSENSEANTQMAALRIDPNRLSIIVYPTKLNQQLSQLQLMEISSEPTIVDFCFSSSDQMILLLKTDEDFQLVIFSLLELESSQVAVSEIFPILMELNYAIPDTAITHTLQKDIDPIELWISPKGLASVTNEKRKRVVAYDIECLLAEAEEEEQDEDQADQQNMDVET